MIGSQALAGWIAHIVFWSVIGIGVVSNELTARGAVVFMGFWTTGFLGLPRLGPFGGLFVTPYVAMLDVVLAFVVFKGDVRLT